MSTAIVTGSAGLIGSEATRFLADKGFTVVGIDNDQRAAFFGAEASTADSLGRLRADLGAAYEHHDTDIRDGDAMDAIWRRYGRDVAVVVHTAAQPSHDWAARDPRTDFGVNAVGTLHVMEATRQHAPDAVVVFTSTNKVYGDTPNRLPLVEQELRFEIDPEHPYADGIAEDMPIDQSMHSLFGASKVAADVLVQEYGRYFGIRTGVFRGGCLTGPNHAGTQLHGFLAYLMRCAMTRTPYTVFGYEGKQVRDNIHSSDLIAAFWAFIEQPRVGAVYNIGGGRDVNCSMREAIALCEEISGEEVDWTYSPENRAGDHIWYVSDLSRFRADHPGWQLRYDIRGILADIHAANADRWTPADRATA